MRTLLDSHVVARKDGGEAVLTCGLCRAELRVNAGQFLELHRFMQQHGHPDVAV